MDDRPSPSLPSRPSDFENRYRLYIDESGDHVYRSTYTLSHRYLCLLGCWFQNPAYLSFHNALEALKLHYLPHHPDDPVTLHREDIVNARKAFKTLQNEQVRNNFNRDLIEIIRSADFHMTAVIIDKENLRVKHGETPGHPYHLGLGFLLQRYAGYLNHFNRIGDVMAEARGGKEDRLLEESYQRVFNHGIWSVTNANYFQSALSSKELKLKSKSANIAGLQLADLLCHPIKMWVLKQYGLYDGDLAPFAQRICEVGQLKFNRHIYKNQIKGYGYVIYP